MEDPATGAALARAIALTGVNRYADARTEVLRHLAAAPASIDGLCLLSQCELELDRPQDALRAAERAVAADPESAWALRLRSLALLALGRSYDAEDAAVAAVRADPHDWSNHHTLARVLVERDEKASTRDSLVRAHEAAQRAVELAPHEPASHVIAGWAAGRFGNADAERAAYERALRLDPQHAVALNNLAAMDLRRARLGTGAKKIITGLRMDPNERILHRNLDAVAVLTLLMLFAVTLLSAFALLVVVAADGQWPHRAGVGMLLLVSYAALIWWPLRHVPGRARGHLRGLPRRMSVAQRAFGAGLVLCALVTLGAAFAPRTPALLEKATRLLGTPYLYLVLAVWLGQAIGAAVRARRRRREFDQEAGP